MRIHYYSHAGRETGYGRAASEYLAGLRQVGEAELIIASELEDVVVHNGAGDADVVVYHGTPFQLSLIVEHLKERPRKMVAVTTWETSIFPDAYARMLGVFDAVIVPSRFCARVIGDAIGAAETFGSAGYKRKLWLIPHAFDPTKWELAERPKRDDDVVTFYTIGAWSERKNVSGVIRAYLSAFSKADKTRLVVISEGANFDVVRSLIARSVIPQDALPGLLVPDRQLSSDEIYRLHLESDCYVSAARCEGFGLGMFEAMIMGRPVISCGYGGQEDFLDDYPGWYKISHQLTPVFAGEGEVLVSDQQVAGTIKLPRGANAKQSWAEPNLVQMADRMRDVCDLIRSDRNIDDEGDREEVDDRYSTTVIGQAFYDVLRKVSE
jgi:glycosyltransferase involved in cell wall biosynthesis